MKPRFKPRTRRCNHTSTPGNAAVDVASLASKYGKELEDERSALTSGDGLEPHIREPMRTRLVRIGYLKLSAPGHGHHGRYVRADRIARVENGRVELSLTSDELNRDD